MSDLRQLKRELTLKVREGDLDSLKSYITLSTHCLGLVEVIFSAVRKNHLHILQYLIENRQEIFYKYRNNLIKGFDVIDIAKEAYRSVRLDHINTPDWQTWRKEAKPMFEYLFMECSDDYEECFFR